MSVSCICAGWLSIGSSCTFGPLRRVGAVGRLNVPGSLSWRVLSSLSS